MRKVYYLVVLDLPSHMTPEQGVDELAASIEFGDPEISYFLPVIPGEELRYISKRDMRPRRAILPACDGRAAGYYLDRLAWREVSAPLDAGSVLRPPPEYSGRNPSVYND